MAGRSDRRRGIAYGRKDDNSEKTPICCATAVVCVLGGDIPIDLGASKQEALDRLVK